MDPEVSKTIQINTQLLQEERRVWVCDVDDIGWPIWLLPDMHDVFTLHGDGDGGGHLSLVQCLVDDDPLKVFLMRSEVLRT